MRLNFIISILVLPLIAFSQKPCKKGDCINGPSIYEGVNFTYNGEYLNGTWHGTGELKQGDYKYVGEFSLNQKNGKGKEYKNNQLVYDGEFVNGQYDGYGKVYIDKKLFYEGEFKYGKIHGFGTVYQESLRDRNGVVVVNGEIEWSGNFEHGQRIESAGNYNFQNVYDLDNIVSDYDKVILNLENINNNYDLYYKFYLPNNITKYYLFDTGCSFAASFPKDEFLELKRNGLKYKKLPIKSVAEIADGRKVPFTYYEFYDIKLDNIKFKKLIVAVRDEKGGDTLIGMELFECFTDYIMPNRKGEMTLHIN